MKYESAILVKVDKVTKEKMRRVKINWSKTIRALIEDEINHQRNLAKAVMMTTKLFRKAKKSKFDSTAVIRYWRDKRYGPDSG